MFTVEQRDALRERVVRLGREDERVVAGAAVGSLAVDAGDRYSDVDLTFAVSDDRELMLEAAEARLPSADMLAERLAELG